MASSGSIAAAAGGAAPEELVDEERQRGQSPSGELDDGEEQRDGAEVPSGEEVDQVAEPRRHVSSQPQRAGANTSSENAEIARLLAEQKRVREDRKRIASELKNAQRRRKRLKHRARLLSTEDLSKVMVLRQIEKTEKEAKAQAKAGCGDSGARGSGLRRS